MALRNALCAVKSDIQEVLQSGNYYVTEEIARELSQINNALDHLALDSTFLSTSEEWQKKPGNYTPRQTNEHMCGAMSALNQIGNRLHECKNKLANRNVQSKQENELRELHQWTISSLQCSQKEIAPFTSSAADRIKQFGDTMGVTDRYTGYRANLTRGTRDPFKMETGWMDKKGETGLMNSLARSHTTIGSPCLEQASQQTAHQVAPGFGPVPPQNIGLMRKKIGFGDATPGLMVVPGYRTNDSLCPTSPNAVEGGLRKTPTMDEVRALNALNASAAYQGNAQTKRPVSCAPYEKMSVQEQAGINTTFPGTTEYMQRFKSPTIYDEPTQDFRINPSPNFGIYKRPMQTAPYIPSFTEYQTRYEWPDAEKIVKMPWLRN